MKKTIRRILILCLTTVILLMSVTKIAAATIYYYFGYYYTYVNSKNVSLHDIDHEEYDMLFVPDTLNNLKLVDIENNAFSNDTGIRLIEFAGATNLERIGSFAFNGCTNVTGEVKIPSNVVDIEVAAFQNCTSLDSVIYNSTCGYVPKQCFKGCTELSSVTLNDSVTSIGDYAFANCTNLSYIEIPASVTYISNTAFQNDNITLGVSYNSYAEQFAKDNGINYEYANILYGDANANGVVDVMDVTYIQKYKALFDGYDLDEYATACADVNKDDKVNICDATLIQMYIAKVISAF